MTTETLRSVISRAVATQEGQEALSRLVPQAQAYGIKAHDRAIDAGRSKRYANQEGELARDQALFQLLVKEGF